MKLNKVNLLLIFFVVIGAVLRFWNIGFQNTNWDEQFTMAFAAPDVGPIALIIKALSMDCNPPLYYLFAQLSMAIFGVTQEAIRYPSAVAGVLLIPVMFWIGKQYKNDLFGLMLAGFTTISYNFIFYSKYGRSYGLELLFFALAFGFFLIANKNLDNRKAKYMFAICCILTVYTQLFAVIPLSVLVAYLMWNERFWLKKFDWVALIIVGCLPLLNLLYVITQTRNVAEVGQQFGAHLYQIVFLIPLDIFAYSCFVIFPIAAYMLWKYRKYEIYSIIIIATVVTYAAMIALSFKTPIILHYALPLTVMLLLPFIEAVYLAIKGREGIFAYGIVVMVVLILEFVQTFALATMQRGA